MAHPPTLGPKWLDTVRKCLPELANAGLWGIEAFSAEIDADGHAELVRLAADYGLRITGGSDSHGRLKVYARLGLLRRADAADYDKLVSWETEGAARSDEVLRKAESL